MTLAELIDCCDGQVRTGPFGSQLHKADYVEDETATPVVMPKDMIDGRIDLSSIARIDKQTRDRLSQHMLSPGDIVLARRGDIGRRVWVGDRESGWLCGTGSMRISLRSCPRVRARYLYYYLATDAAIGWLEGHAVGATMSNLSAGVVEQLPVKFPPIEVQDLLVVILDSIGRLSENNQRRIEILEDVARRIYREWFVHFRFPGCEDVEVIDSDLGPIPAGWDVAQIADVCRRLQAGATPKRSEERFWDSHDFDWYKTGELQDDFLFESEEGLSAAGAKTGRLFDERTILMAIYGSPTVGRLGVLTHRASCNQAALGLVSNPAHVNQVFLYYKLWELRSYFNSIAQGAAQQNISKEKVAQTPIAVPSRELLARFEQVVEPMWSFRQNLGRQVRLLSEARDLLLPRLLSGALDVSDLHLDLEPVA